MAREFTDDIQEKAFSQPAHRNVETCKKKTQHQGKNENVEKMELFITNNRICNE